METEWLILILAIMFFSLVKFVISRKRTERAVRKLIEEEKKGEAEEMKKRKSSQEDAVYEVIVEMENPEALKSNKQIVEAAEGKINGEVYYTIVGAEGGTYLESLAPYIRRLYLTDETDFEEFRKIIIQFKGVVGARKGSGPWLKTEKELAAEEEERVAMSEIKKRLAETEVEEIKKKFLLWQQTMEKTAKSDEVVYGPSQGMKKIIPNNFKKFFKGAGRFQAECRTTHLDSLQRQFDFKQGIQEFTDLKEAVAFLEKTINEDFRIPFQPKTAFFEIPFEVEYRDNGKKYAHLFAMIGSSFFVMGGFEVFFREL